MFVNNLETQYSSILESKSEKGMNLFEQQPRQIKSWYNIYELIKQ